MVMFRILSVTLGSILILLALRGLFMAIAPHWLGWIDLVIGGTTIIVTATFAGLHPSLSRAALPICFAAILLGVWYAARHSGRHDGFVWWQLAIAGGYALVAAGYLALRGHGISHGRGRRPEQGRRAA
jgi:hypothetical protein